MNRNSNSEFKTYRRRFGWAMLFAGICLIGLSTLSSVPVSAGQSAAATPAADAHPEFPEGVGKDAVMRLCVRCHSPNIILASGQDRAGWESTITKMVHMGATGNDDDFTDIADYLTKNFPPSTVKKVFVNLATEKQLSDALGISIDDAKAIVTYRDQQKGFESLDDMKKVPGIDVKNLDAKKDSLIFGKFGGVKP